MSSPQRRRRRAIGLLVLLAALAVLAAVAVVPAVTGMVDGLRALGGEGAGAPAVDDGGGPSAAESSPAGTPAEVPAGAQAATVDRVVDGDTLRVRVAEPGGPIPPTDSIRVRLLNVDAPELDHPQRGEDCGATEATAFLEALVPPGSAVHLVADTEDRDRYGRPLRGVWSADGRFVNGELVEAGWAEVVLFEPNDRFHAPLLERESQARSAGRGAWGACDGFPG